MRGLRLFSPYHPCPQMSTATMLFIPSLTATLELLSLGSLGGWGSICLFGSSWPRLPILWSRPPQCSYTPLPAPLEDSRMHSAGAAKPRGQVVAHAPAQGWPLCHWALSGLILGEAASFPEKLLL